MNLSNQPFRIHGFVIDNKSFQGLKGLRVEAWDKELFCDDVVGFAETDEKGAFEISWDQTVLKALFTREPELYFKVFHHDICIANTKNSILWSQKSGDTPVHILVDKPIDGEFPCSPTQPESSVKATDPDHFISGRLIDVNKQGLAQYTVVLAEYDLGGLTPIDRAITNKYGTFEFEFAYGEGLQQADHQTEPDLVFQVFDSTGVQIEIASIFILKDQQESAVSKISESQKAPFVLMNAPANLSLKIVVGVQQTQRSVTEFERLVTQLTPFMGKIGFADLKEDETYFQISFLSKESGIEKAIIEQLRDAFKHERDSIGIPAWVFYELALQKISISDLIYLTGDNIVASLKSNQPQSDSSDLEVIEKQLLQYGKDKNIQTQVDDLKTSVGDLLQPILASEQKLTTFLDAYARHDGDIESFWQSMSQNKDFAAQVPKIQLNLQLAQLTLNNGGLIQALQQEGIENTRQLVDLSSEKWEALAINHKEGIPAHITGKDDVERARTYAQELQTLVELAFPTDVIKKNVQHAEVKTFLDRNPEFDFTRTPVDSYLYDQKEHAFHAIKDVKVVTTQLRKMQRLYTLTANTADMNVLMDMQYDSAHQIAKLSPENFARTLEGKISEQNAQVYHAKALAVSNTTAMLYQQLRDLIVTPGFKATGDQLVNLKEQHAIPNNALPGWLNEVTQSQFLMANDKRQDTPADTVAPNWRNLFGSLDLCECQHCNSVYSPAAYFVDLLHILLEGAPRKEIFRRRPDLRYTKLSCEHTENLIPYIDLVNEILETYVAQENVGDTKADEHARDSTNDTSGFTSSDLIANPQHPNEESKNDAEKAYGLIKEAFFPLTLPFDMDLEVARQFLLEQKSSRFEVMKTFGNAASYATAAEQLGISEQEFRILTLKDLDGVTDAKRKSDGTFPGKLIDVVKGLWGEPENLPAETLGVTLRQVNLFIERAGIAYTDLVDLLNTRFLNKNFPIIVFLQTLTPDERTSWLATNTDEDQAALQVIELGSDDPKAPCDLSKTFIQHLDRSTLRDEELSHFNRFIRLWKKLGCTIAELDGLLAALQAKDITPEVIQALSIVWQVQQRLDLSLERVAVLIGNIPTVGKDSLYAKLFRNNAILQIDPKFELNIMQDQVLNSSEHLKDHVPAILAAFAITEEDLNLIAGYVKLDLATDTLNLANLSQLYRYIVFAKGLRMKIKDLITWLNLISVSPWGNATDLWNTLEQLEKLQQYGFKAADFAYIFLKERVSDNTLPPSDELVEQNTKLLREGLQKIRQENTPSNGHVTADFLKTRLGILLEPNEVDKVIAILSKVNGDPDKSNTKALFSDLITLNVLEPYQAVLNGYLNAEKANNLEATIDIPQRLALYWGHIEPKLVPLLRETLVHQHLIASFKTEADIVKLMLKESAISQTCLAVETDNLTNNQAYAERYILMHRFTWLVGKLKLSGKELQHFENNPNFGNFSWKALDFKSWLRIADFVALRDSLPPAESNLLSVFNTAAKTGGDIAQAIVDVTAWDKINVKYFVTRHAASAFQNEIALIDLQKKLALSEKIGVSIEKLESWTTDSVSDEQSRNIKRTLKAKYNEEAWVAVSTTVHNRLRIQLRDALVAYLLQEKEIMSIGLKSANDLYAYFLIDVEMGACMLTSRLKQAIASVQLFVQRCLLSLEQRNNILPDMINAKQWEWMKNYRVWEANRKVFLYPENWIEPELRDDKSPFFKELESELLQGEFTDEIAEQKLMHYLEKLDEVARLDICGIYEDHSAQEMHVFGRTFNFPPKYFYRKLNKITQVWTAWEHVPLDIQGNEDGDSAGVHLMPVVWNRRLYLFWPIFTEKSDKEKIKQDQESHNRWKERKEARDNAIERIRQKNNELDKKLENAKRKLNFLQTEKEYTYEYDDGMGGKTTYTEKGLPDDHPEVISAQKEIERLKSIPREPEPEIFNEPEPKQSSSPWSYYEVRIAWSECREKKWSNKSISQSFIRTPSDSFGVEGKWFYRFSLHLQNSILKIGLHYQMPAMKANKINPHSSLLAFSITSHLGEFQFNCNSKIIALIHEDESSLLGFIKPKQVSFYQSFLSAITNFDSAIRWNEGGSLPLTLIGDQGKGIYKILSGSEREYKVLFPADYDFSHGSPSDFIYQDHKRNYYVEYSEDAWARADKDYGVVRNPKKAPIDAPIPKIKLPVFPKITDRTDSLTRELLGVTDQLSYAMINELVEKKQVTTSTALQLRASRSFIGKTSDSISKSKDHLDTIASKLARNPPQFISKKRTLKFKPFFHAYVCKFMEELNEGGIDGLFIPVNQQLIDVPKLSRDLEIEAARLESLIGEAMSIEEKIEFLKKNNFERIYKPDKFTITKPYPMEEVDFSPDGAYSLYNWELFFHVPMLIANRLSQNQRFEKARRWYHFIFNPTTNENLDKNKNPDPSVRFWQVIPFRNTKKETLEALMMQLHNNNPSDPNRKAFEAQITAWRNSHFNPHLIARMRLGAYQRNVVMKYLDNLIAWADSLFQQDTMESINEATQLYILAAELLGGNRPEKIPTRVKNNALNYADLESKGLDAFSNALVQLETLFPFYNIQPISLDTEGVGPIVNSTAPSLYFCIPNNEKLLGYWDTIADRLFKIRHCQNIEGIERQLALFEPEIDPALLVRAVAGGVDIRSVLADLNSPVPYYRFNYMLQKALEICAELKSLGTSLLAALEKKDAEALSMMRTQHETMLLNLVKTIRNLQITESQRNREGLEKTKEVIEHRADYYAQLLKEGLNASEKQQQILNFASMALSVTGQMAKTATSLTHPIPDSFVGAMAGPSGGAITLKHIGGGNKSGNALSAVGDFFHMLSTMTSFAASTAQTNAGYQRRAVDWKFQGDLAKKELSQVDKQILAAEIREQIAERELTNHEQQLDNARQVEEFMRNKYTQEDLYGWMIGRLSPIYFQCYQLAYDLAKKAEKAYRHELGLQSSSFIQFGIWDSFRKGLLSGEQLYLSLKQMEKSYMDQNRREFEISKHVSLLQHNPLALIALRETGTCTIELPETLFDVDYPGHYMRRIKNVRLSIPCVVGPYTSVNCTLTLLRSKTRISAEAGTYAGDMDSVSTTGRVITNFAALESIATSSAQNDSGLFELNFRDERYLPFEGSGVVSLWRIELPKDFRQFDYETISDVVLNINYTSRQGGAALRDVAVKNLTAILKDEAKKPQARLFSLRHEFSSEWYQLQTVAAANGDHRQAFSLAKYLFPSMFRSSTITINAIELFGIPKNLEGAPKKLPLTVTLTNPDGAEVKLTNADEPKYGQLARLSSGDDVGIEVKHVDEKTRNDADWTLKVDKAHVSTCLEQLDDMLILCHYSVTPK